MNALWSNAAEMGWVALGGGVGSAARYAVERVISLKWRGRFPWGVFMVNLSGAMLLGLFMGLVSAGSDHSLATILIGTGLLGGYTTFSTASIDAVRLARDGHRLMTLTYAVGTMLGTIVAALAGLWLGEMVSAGTLGGG